MTPRRSFENTPNLRVISPRRSLCQTAKWQTKTSHTQSLWFVLSHPHSVLARKKRCGSFVYAGVQNVAGTIGLYWTFAVRGRGGVICSHNALRGTQEEWETMGLEKRIDFDNLKRVFERLDFKHDGRIDMEELADIYKVVNPFVLVCLVVTCVSAGKRMLTCNRARARPRTREAGRANKGCVRCVLFVCACFCVRVRLCE